VLDRRLRAGQVGGDRLAGRRRGGQRLPLGQIVGEVEVVEEDIAALDVVAGVFGSLTRIGVAVDLDGDLAQRPVRQAALAAGEEADIGALLLAVDADLELPARLVGARDQAAVAQGLGVIEVPSADRVELDGVLSVGRDGEGCGQRKAGDTGHHLEPLGMSLARHPTAAQR